MTRDYLIYRPGSKLKQLPDGGLLMQSSAIIREEGFHHHTIICKNKPDQDLLHVSLAFKMVENRSRIFFTLS